MRRERRKNIEAVKYALTLPKYINEARRHPSYPAIKKRWEEMDKLWIAPNKPRIVFDEAGDVTKELTDKMLGEMPVPSIRPRKGVMLFGVTAE